MTTEDITVATGSQSYINTHLGDEWTLPYDAYDAATIKMCPEGVCPTNVPQNISQFVSYGVSLRAGPLGPYALVPDYRFGTAVRVPATAPTQTWDVPGLTLRFKPFHTLSVGGTLALAGTTLTSTTTTGRWGGVTVDGGSLTMGAGSGIARVQGEVYHPAALLVTSGTALLNGATVAGTTSGNGVYVTGGSASAAISGVTDISLNASGAGVRVDAGGTVTVDGDGVQIHDNTEGIVASGAGTLANVYGGRIRDNLGGPGLRATSGARIEVLRLPPGGGGGTESFSSSSSQPVRLERNIGGLYATGTGKMVGGVIATETTFECVQEPCPPSPLGQHSFVDNNSGAAFDASALTGSQVLATYNYWGRGPGERDLIEIQDDPSSLVQIDPILTAPPSNAVAASRMAGVGSGRDAGPVRRGRVGADVQARLAAADRAVQARDSVGAGAQVLAAWAHATTDDDRLAVAEAAGRVLTAVQPTALVAWAGSGAATAGAVRPWARRALALDLAGQERFAEAASVARALADEDGAGAGAAAESHRVRGLALLVEIGVAARDRAGALAALGALAAVDPEGAADAALSVAVAFPEDDVTLVLGRGMAAAAVAAKDGVDARPAGGATLTAGPNPAAGAVRVSLMLAAAGDVSVEVFDALGRRVAVLHDGAAPAGPLGLTLDAAALPAGVYVVRARLGGAGAASVLTRTVTVAR